MALRFLRREQRSTRPLFGLVVAATVRLTSSMPTKADAMRLSPPSATSLVLRPASRALTPAIITIAESTWRSAADDHSRRVESLLKPGLTPSDHPLNSGQRCNRDNRRRQQRGGAGRTDRWTALDPADPIYNFLIEYYGLRGAKGPRKLGRWSPNPALLLEESVTDGGNRRRNCGIDAVICSREDEAYEAAMRASRGLGGILLENANLDDLGGALHLRGGVPVPVEGGGHDFSYDDDDDQSQLHGILYNPAVFYYHLRRNKRQEDDSEQRRLELAKTMAPFQWYLSILRTTLASEPVLHCHGLHEWAMLYHPRGADPPPSAKYQSGLPLRVSREVINKTVERRGIHCTHVDALRFFAPAAGSLNHHGASLDRRDQLRLEQRGCVHAHMDLLKICLKIQSFVDPRLLGDVLEVALDARRLDVAASPYDASMYGAGAIPVETEAGRKRYREEQTALMKSAELVRRRLLGAYEGFMSLAFVEEPSAGHVGADAGCARTAPYIAPERLAKATPGGPPWRMNVV